MLERRSLSAATLPQAVGIGIQYFPNLVAITRRGNLSGRFSGYIARANGGSAAIFHFGNLGRNVVMANFQQHGHVGHQEDKITESRLIELRWRSSTSSTTQTLASRDARRSWAATRSEPSRTRALERGIRGLRGKCSLP